MKHTAVEWLVNQYIEKLTITPAMVEQAKEMEKEQIKDAHIEGFYSPPFGKSRNGEAEKYYNETFKLK